MKTRQKDKPIIFSSYNDIEMGPSEERGLSNSNNNDKKYENPTIFSEVLHGHRRKFIQMNFITFFVESWFLVNKYITFLSI